MKHLKMIGVSLGVVASLVLPSSSMATSLTSNGSTFTGSIKAESVGHVSLHGPLGVNAQCAGSLETKIEQHGSSVTAKGALSSFILNGCTNGYSITILSWGTFEYHTQGISVNSHGTVTSDGLTVTLHTPLGFNCHYRSNNAHAGVITGNAPGALIHLDVILDRVAHSGLCGATGRLTGSYKVTSPTSLAVD